MQKGLYLTVASVFLASAALAQVDDALQSEGWREVAFSGKTPNRFAPDDAGAIAVESDGSVSLMQKPLSVDLEKNPVLSWRWRATEQAPPTDLSVKGDDDRSIALYVAFPYVEEQASGMERIERAVVERTVGKDAPGRVLMYVWGGDGDRGDRVKSPYLGGSGIMTILRPAGTETGSWFDEAVDVAEDYRQTFGNEPPDPMSIAIGADTDDTGTTARALITDLTFGERSKAF